MLSNNGTNVFVTTMMIAAAVAPAPSFGELTHEQQNEQQKRVHGVQSRLDYMTQGDMSQVSSFNGYPVRTPQDQETIVLSQTDFKAFVDTLKKPAQINSAFQKALEFYNRHVLVDEL